MKTKRFSNIHTLFATLITATLLLASCGNPASNDEEEHHDEAAGIVLTMNAQEIARYDESGVTGGITVQAGEETALITIRFLAEDGDLFQPDEPEFTLRWKDIDESVAEVEQHGEDGKWSFHIHGESEGSTSVVFQLYHNEHSDFDSAPIPVTVTAAN